MTPRPFANPLIAAVALLVMTSCSAARAEGDPAADPAADPTSSSVTASVPATSSTSSTTPTTAAPEPSAPSTVTTQRPKPSTSPTTKAPPKKAVADGSGCTPGSGPLPDGRWYGEIVDTEADSFDFDLACYFTGPDATLAASEDGAESPPPNDYHVRNDNRKVRELRVDGSSEVTWYPNAGDPGSEATITWAEWIEAVEDRGATLGVWIQIDDGLVTIVHEQWVP